MNSNPFGKIVRAKIARASAAAMCLLFCASAHAAGPNSDAPPNDPEAERRAFKVADGFEVNLFASEPMIAKPIGINFDAKGRLWVAGSTTYPQVKPGDTPNDKIYVLEDTNNDGKADKVTVFAEGLFLATSIEIDPSGGVYAANSTEVLYLKDTDGDGKADQKRVVFSGFGTEDTHHVIHGFRWDYGGRLNFLQGIYIGSRVETPRGTRVGLASTLWQFRPETMDLGIYCQGLINPWGVTWDRYGQMFLTDGAGGEGVNFAPPGAQFTAAYGASRVLKGLNPGSPKYCGAEIVDGRHLPEDWQGDLLTNDFRANRTVRFKLTEDGSGFAAKLMPDLITSTDKAYRPIDIKMGPDGAIYIADWYNPIINHGEVDFRDPRRDKVHGRIWRVTAKGRPLVEKPKIDGATADELVALLTAPEQWTRLQAKQHLRARGAKEALPALEKSLELMMAQTLTPELASQKLLEILWACETLDVPDAKVLQRVLAAPMPHVRAAAVRVAGHWGDRIPATRNWVVARLHDESPRVRLEAIRALADIAKNSRDGTVVRDILLATDHPVDPVIDFVLYQALSESKDLWLAGVTSGQIAFHKPEHQAYALKAVQSGAALQKIVADLKAGKVADAGKRDAYDLVATLGAPSDVSILLDHANNAKVDQGIRLAALSALERAAKQRKITPSGPTPARVKKLMADPSPAVQELAARLAGLYKANDARPDLENVLTAEKSTPAVRIAAAQSLADLGGQSIAALQKAAGTGNPSSVRAAAIAGLAVADQKSAATLAAQYLTTARPEDDPAPVLGAFLKREGGLATLSDALKGKKIPVDTAKLSLRYVQGVGVDIGPLGEVIRTSAGAGAGGAVQLSAEEMKKTIEEVATKGDPARGEIVYRSAAAGCVQCHQIGGAGGPLAPDLRAIGASSPVDYIIDSILVPNKATKDGYAGTSVSTKDGDLVQGIKVRETAKELVLRDNARDEIIIPISEIKKRVEGGSLMPAGLQDGLTRQEFLDLIRFLAELGKPGPYSVPTQPLIRRWRTIAAKSADANPPAADAAWLPAYSRVNGELPRAEILAGNPGGAFVQFELQSNEAGAARLIFNKTQGLTAWVNGKPLQLTSPDVKIDVVKGVTTVTLKVPAGEEPIRVESAEVQGSPARAVPVLGR